MANKLFLPQPTITSHIQSLEKELGTVLLNRSSKEISLTEGGQILYEYALNILDLKDKAIFSLDSFRGKIKGVLTLAASSIPEQYVLPELILEFRKKYPDVIFDVMHYSSMQAIDSIAKHELEFAMVGTKIQHPKLTFVDLLEERLAIIAPNHWEKLENLTLEELIKLPIILREKWSGTRIEFERILKDAGYTFDDLNVVCYLQSSEAVKEAVEAAYGEAVHL